MTYLIETIDNNIHKMNNNNQIRITGFTLSILLIILNTVLSMNMIYAFHRTSIIDTHMPMVSLKNVGGDWRKTAENITYENGILCANLKYIGDVDIVENINQNDNIIIRTYKYKNLLKKRSRRSCIIIYESMNLINDNGKFVVK